MHYSFEERSSYYTPYPFYLGSVSKDFLVNKMKEISLWGKVFEFWIGYGLIDVKDIHTSYSWLFDEKTWYKMILRLIKSVFVVVLSFGSLNMFS